MINFIKHLINRWENRESLKLGGAIRSSEWPAVRTQHLQKSSTCAICGGGKKIQVHHKKPFHLEPKLELDPDNLITLCEEKNCHLRFGHLYSFKSYNPFIDSDAVIWREKIKNRP